MPKFSLLLGRKTIQVYDIEEPRVRVGRAQDADILIDNASVSRSHAEFRKEADGWVVEDLGSSNGTFLRGERIENPRPVTEGDEVGFGKFSIVFGKALGEEPRVKARASTMPTSEGTTHIKSHEVKELLKDSERQRRAHLAWESGGRTGTHYLSEAPAALFGRDELCDVRVPKGPKHHLLFIRKNEKGCEVRNLHWWTGMKVGGKKMKRARLTDGDVVEMGGLKVVFVDEMG